MQDLFDWTFRLVACAFTFSLALILGVLYTIPEGASQAQPAPAAAVVKAPAAPANYALGYPKAYTEFRKGFMPEFHESFRTSCGKDASSATAEDACSITFNVMAEYNFGAFPKNKVDQIMRDPTHEEWVGFSMLPPDLKVKIERALMPMIVTRVGNKTIYK